MKKKEDENLNEDSNTGFIILIVVILLVFFALTAGAIQKLKKRKEVLESEKEVKKLQYNKSQNKLELKKEKKKQLEKIFKFSYLLSRILIVSLIIGFNLLLYFYWGITDVDGLINRNEIVIFSYALFTYIVHGSFKELTKTFENLKNSLRKWVFRNHLNIDDEIIRSENLMNENHEQIKELDMEIESIGNEIISFDENNRESLIKLNSQGKIKEA